MNKLNLGEEARVELEKGCYAALARTCELDLLTSLCQHDDINELLIEFFDTKFTRE